RRSTGRTRRPGNPSCGASTRSTSPTTPTWRPPARPPRSARSRGPRGTPVCTTWCCCPGAARTRRRSASASSRRPGWSGRWCGRAGSRRTSARTTCSNRSWPARSPSPSGDVPEPFADADDVADVAVAALTRPGHTGRVYEVTGPRALTMAEAVAEIGRAAGRDVAFVPVAVDDYAAVLKEQGVEGELIEFLTYLFSTVLDGRNSRPADGVRRALGREPRDFAEYARRTAATGVWNG